MSVVAGVARVWWMTWRWVYEEVAMAGASEDPTQTRRILFGRSGTSERRRGRVAAARLHPGRRNDDKGRDAPVPVPSPPSPSLLAPPEPFFPPSAIPSKHT
jgi:hypothetical protein